MHAAGLHSIWTSGCNTTLLTRFSPHRSICLAGAQKQGFSLAFSLPFANANKPCEQDAYLVAVLHSLKYPANSVNGVLLGSCGSDGAVQVQQALPLLHSHLALAPMMDAGSRDAGHAFRLWFYYRQNLWR